MAFKDVNDGKALQRVAVLSSTGIYPIDPNSEITVFTNRGATGIVGVTLPPAKVGMHYKFYVQATQWFQVDPNGTEVVSLVGAAQGAGSYLQNSVIGSVLDLVCLEDGKWHDLVTRGTWSAV